MTEGKILIIDDEKDMVDNCTRILSFYGYECFPLYDSDLFEDFLKKTSPDIILTDIRMEGKDGFEILKRAKEINSDAIVILFTAYANIEDAVRAIKEGAFDYLPKPFSTDHLLTVIKKAMEFKRLKDENIRLHTCISELREREKIVGNSVKIRKVLDLAEKIAKTDSNVLLYGESGTGKELIARFIHKLSYRSKKPLIPVDCSTIPENLAESELFGHEKGAFTGAYQTKKGLIEMANGGTLFLDEISRLYLPIQAKFLRALQEKQIRRLGGRELIDVDIRVISATNLDLKELIKKGVFLEELYYRINVIEIEIPPLRERKEDIPLLVNHFIKIFSGKNQKNVLGVKPDCMEILERYDWPGNVRELMNTIERAVSLCDKELISCAELPEHIVNYKGTTFIPSSSLPYKEALKIAMEEFHKNYIKSLLGESNTLTEASKKAGIDRKTLYRLIKRFRIRE